MEQRPVPAEIPTLTTLARAKINLCLLLGPLRDDGYHEVATVIMPVDLADVVTIQPSLTGSDEVVCPGVDGDNLAAKAVRLFREHSGWDGPAVRLTIDKRVPVAAGMGGGSGDAEAALRLVAAVAGNTDEHLLGRIAPLLGADVPAMLAGVTCLATGLGEVLEPLPAPAEAHLIVLPAAAGLSTPRVFGKAAELGLRRSASELEQAAARVRNVAAVRGWAMPADTLGINDPGAAAVELSSEVGAALTAGVEAGADSVFVTGSGPTVIAMFGGSDAQSRRDAALAALTPRTPPAIACAPSRGSATIEEVA